MIRRMLDRFAYGRRCDVCGQRRRCVRRKRIWAPEYSGICRRCFAKL